jgi:hypothetical protein
VHKNATLAPRGRARLVHRIIVGALPEPGTAQDRASAPRRNEATPWLLGVIAVMVKRLVGLSMSANGRACNSSRAKLERWSGSQA